MTAVARVRFNEILARLKTAECERCLLSGTTALHEITGGKIVAIDGKTSRGSDDKATIRMLIE